MERYVIRFEKTETPDIHSSGVDVDGNHYLISESGNTPQGEARKKAFEYLTKFLKERKFPKGGMLETTIYY